VGRCGALATERKSSEFDVRDLEDDLARLLGGAVQVDPIKPTLKPPGTLELSASNWDMMTLLSSFAFRFELRRYTSARPAVVAAASREWTALAAGPGAGPGAGPAAAGASPWGRRGWSSTAPSSRRQGITRGLHSSTFLLNLSRFGHTSPCPPV